MRVISGSARRLALIAPRGEGTRPTTDRIKETLFNIINPDLYECSFLDIFSGSGAVGIEALSRGANNATFIENNKEAIDCIITNLEHTKLINKSTILKTDYKIALDKLSNEGKAFDIIFIDPPYDKLIEKDVLEILSKSSLINENTIIIVEASIETSFDYVKDLGLELNRIKDYKTNVHAFISR
jgi:16S rRNA (guanine966-N2)-methyltransferase